MDHPTPSALLHCYHKILSEHPHGLLPLETSLPPELRPPARDPYRTALTMILSVRTSDLRLSLSLAKLFSRYPSFSSLQALSRPQLHRALKQAGFLLSSPYGSGNGGRLWSLLQLYFGPWEEELTEERVEELCSLRVRGFGPKVLRLLQAYCFGNPKVLPLDTPAFQALQDLGFYPNTPIHQAREDLEEKLGGMPGLALIDLHELLRFRGQAGRVHPQSLSERQKKILVGWNAWRLLTSAQRKRLSLLWVRQHLLRDPHLSAQLWQWVQSMDC